MEVKVGIARFRVRQHLLIDVILGFPTVVTDEEGLVNGRFDRDLSLHRTIPVT